MVLKRNLLYMLYLYVIRWVKKNAKVLGSDDAKI